MIEIYTDGSCKNNKSGGYGVCVLTKDKNSISNYHIDYLYSKQVNNTTNNRMELTALLYALELTQNRYKQEKCIIKSDSAYCVNMFNDWLPNWCRNGWYKYDGDPIENIDLVKSIWQYRKIEWANFYVEKVPGHDNILGNEIADSLATASASKLDKILKENELEYKIEGLFDSQ